MPRTPNETIQSQFRLEADTLDDLDIIADWLSLTHGVKPTRANAIRHAARITARMVQNKSAKNRKNYSKKA